MAKVIVMRHLNFAALALMLLCACSKDDWSEGKLYFGEDICHDEIQLGSRLENPYKTENIRAAYSALCPTKAATEVKTTNLYVRFLPRTDKEYDAIMAENIDVLDHPLDYSIKREGDWYHDPEIPEDDYTWFYAVVPKDFNFKYYQYEKIDECVIMEHEVATRAFGVDWSEVEKQAYRMTGNENLIEDAEQAGMFGTRSSKKQKPSGRITIIDPDYNGGRPFGVSGVRVSCNSFVKFSRCYTDRDGYYQMPKSFSSKLRYRLVFTNKKGFAIGFNAIVVPASVSTLGRGTPEGISLTVKSSSEGKLFRRCVVNNAAYDYYERCSGEDLNITTPASNLRFWIFNNISASSTVMMHHGTIVNDKNIKKFLGPFGFIVTLFAPDITIGTKGSTTYKDIYKSVVHEMSHASHFAQVGTYYWNQYIRFIIESYLRGGADIYGKRDDEGSGYCEIGEMWGYYMESRMFYDRYGGNRQSFGSSWWFYPQIFRYLEDRGMSPSQIFAAMQKDITSRDELQAKLCSLYPSKKSLIQQAFSRYVDTVE